ncbi:multiple sugar transport system substrate-binding protein [Streptomyces umbrinus]|uniref:extracellular solute-binding protein n=1 Tax=Streptomyces umbrinus TaxID=67370 RepID=UPI00167C7E4C|nr:extracellular solute-binding protein [Streptomyces umbrinus]MCR3723370.1 multiple sugar transport system substrate-binding protein [Streptomyces umbrinus]GHH61838.1 solute-binding protein [Streptomyces umbrinus]
MRARRLTGSLAWLVVVTLTAAGCGLSGGSDDGGATAGGCKVDEGNVGSGKLTGDVEGKITFQTTNLKKDFGGFFNGVIKDFEKANPGTSVKWIDDPGDSTFTQRTVADAQGCTMPDVINIDAPTATALTKAGYLLNVGVKDPDAAKPFVPAFWKSSTYKDASGKAAHTVLPWYTGGVLLTYNTDMLKKAGIDPAKPPKTMFGLFADYEKIAKSAKGKYFATMANPIWRIPADWDQMDIRTLSADGKSAVFADDPRTTQWVAWMARLYKEGAMPKDSLSSSNDPSTPYSQGQVAYGSTNPSFVRFVKQNSPSVYAKTGVGQQPFDALGHTTAAPQYISVAATSKHAPTALAFAKFLTNAENQTAWCKDPNVVIFPTTTTSLDDPFFQNATGSDPFSQARKLVAEQLKTTTAYQTNVSPAVQKAIVSQVQLAMQGKKSPEQAVKDAQEKANELLKQAG